jgi:hypothetical protein
VKQKQGRAVTTNQIVDSVRTYQGESTLDAAEPQQPALDGGHYRNRPQVYQPAKGENRKDSGSKKSLQHGWLRARRPAPAYRPHGRQALRFER